AAGPRRPGAPRRVRAMGRSAPTPAPPPGPGPEDPRPRVGLIPNSPHTLAGIRIEPPPSLPCANGSSPAETAAAAPPLEPPADRPVSQGQRAGGATSGSV